MIVEPALLRSDQSLGARFLQSSARYPDRPALTVGGRSFTYKEVEEKARRWAGALTNALPTAPERVGIYAYRSEVSYVSVLAILFSGATFVPLNPNYPPERNRAMAKAAGLNAIFTDASSAPKLMDVLDGVDEPPLIVVPDTDSISLDLKRRALTRPEVDETPPLMHLPSPQLDAMAYLLFTSGSTGQPKGVPISHGNVSHFLDVNQSVYGITPQDRLSQTFDQTFDLSVFDLFMAWSHGACVCAIPSLHLLAPFRFLREQAITVWFSVPSVANLLRRRNLLTPGSLPGLRLSLFCGEPLPRQTAEAWQTAAPDSVVENLYGPTELTIACARYRWSPPQSPSECLNDVVPIGQVYEGLHQLIVDENLQPVSPGEPGELCVAGAQTFVGYWNDPAKTAAATFVQLGANGEALRYYRTGDRVVERGEGVLAYLGRVDHQVKVMGHRIELGEIESVLRSQPGVVEAVVVAWPVVDGTAQGLVAFVTGAGAECSALESAVRRTLPAYMVPNEIHVMDSLPLNSNGKVDRNTLRRQLAGV